MHISYPAVILVTSERRDLPELDRCVPRSTDHETAVGDEIDGADIPTVAVALGEEEFSAGGVPTHD